MTTPTTIPIVVGTTIARAVELLVVATLEACGGNKVRAARTLGISRRGLYDKLSTYTIAPSTADTEVEHVPGETEDAARDGAA